MESGVLKQPPVRPGVTSQSSQRRLAVGAEVAPGGGVHFRVWAPKRRDVTVVLEGSTGGNVQLNPEPGGYFSGIARDARAGSRYRFRLGADEQLYPDPASRFQPDGPHGPSQVVDASTFQWTDDRWPGVTPQGQ